MAIDFFTECDIKSDIETIEKIIQTDIFMPNNIRNVFMKSAFIEVLICLRDLMYKTERLSSRINFTDDVVITNDVQDVSDLIKYVRDALCHIESQNHFISNTKVKATFNIAYGKCNIMQIGNISISSDYDDDICFCFGEQKVYLNRHILRAFNEAKKKLLPLI